jgi:signal transduction histidine kinase/HAMP domain-containing protein
MNALGSWRRLNLWPRLALTVTLGFVLLFGLFSLLALRAVSDSTDRTLKERLVIAQMAAGEENRLLERGFYELVKATQFAAFDPRASSLTAEYQMLAYAYGRVGTLSLGVYFLDARGRVVLSQPPGKLPTGTDLGREPYVRRVLESRRRSVSAPFRDPTTGKPAVALTIPILNPDRSLRSLLVGLLDVASAEVLKPLEYAVHLGHTGHAELVNQRGLVIASTDEPGAFLKPGEHSDFYVRMLKAGTSGVENVVSHPWHPIPGDRPGEHHVMAFAPLSAAPWGLAIGGSAQETFAPMNHLRSTLLLTGALSLAFLWVLTLVGARLLVHPVRILTEAARGMAAGNLEQPVRSGEGGEIGVLGESLEAMRAQLRQSLETVRRWGEELEVKVTERTAELTTRNRQLAAVTAVATAANQAHDLESMLSRCLEVVLEHTGMDAGAVRLLDDRSGQLGVPVSQGDYGRFPCQDKAVGVGECTCGLVASTGTRLYLDPAARERFQPPCRAPEAQALSILPLRGPKGTLGVLYLSRSRGDPPGPAERRTLEAICNQIAVAVENARLLEGLRQMEAQSEVQRLKAELISAVSHELRTPLGFIKGYATTLLREDVAPIDAATRREFLQIIDEETGKLQQMIDDLLDTSRFQAGQPPLERSPMALAELVESAVNKIRPGLRETGHSVAIRLPAEDLRVLADPMRVEQVLDNLLDNAARYSEPSTPVEVAVQPDDGYAVVSVTDRGDGIPEAEQEHVFEPFHRGENSRRRGVHGTGLGLAICRGIVEAQSGHIWVESVPGRGSTFRFTLPLIEDAGTTGGR